MHSYQYTVCFTVMAATKFPLQLREGGGVAAFAIIGRRSAKLRMRRTLNAGIVSATHSRRLLSIMLNKNVFTLVNVAANVVGIRG